MQLTHGATLIIALPIIIPVWQCEFAKWVDYDVAPLRIVTRLEDGTRGEFAYCVVVDSAVVGHDLLLLPKKIEKSLLRTVTS